MAAVGSKAPFDDIRGMSGLRTTSGPPDIVAVGLRCANRVGSAISALRPLIPQS